MLHCSNKKKGRKNFRKLDELMILATTKNKFNNNHYFGNIEKLPVFYITTFNTNTTGHGL